MLLTSPPPQRRRCSSLDRGTTKCHPSIEVRSRFSPSGERAGRSDQRENATRTVRSESNRRTHRPPEQRPPCQRRRRAPLEGTALSVSRVPATPSKRQVPSASARLVSRRDPDQASSGDRERQPVELRPERRAHRRVRRHIQATRVRSTAWGRPAAEAVPAARSRHERHLGSAAHDERARFVATTHTIERRNRAART